MYVYLILVERLTFKMIRIRRNKNFTYIKSTHNNEYSYTVHIMNTNVRTYVWA